jgi:hypothetical protein
MWNVTFLALHQVNRKRAEREEAFRRMELEALLLEDDDFEGEGGGGGGGGGGRGTQEELQQSGVSVEELLRVLEEAVPGAADKRAAASRELLGHLGRYREQQGGGGAEEEARLLEQFSGMEEEEALLRTFSLQELFMLSMGNQQGLFSEYLVHRSRQILDAVLSKHI